MIGDQNEAGRDWIIEAHAVVQDWEAQTSGRLLSFAEAAALADYIAHALHDAFELGRRSSSSPRETTDNE